MPTLEQPERKTVKQAWVSGRQMQRSSRQGSIAMAAGDFARDRAIATGVVEVLRGRGDLLDRFANTFSWLGDRRWCCGRGARFSG